MKRVRRWLWNGLTVLSLLLCVGVCALWVRSYWRADVVQWRDGTRTKMMGLSATTGSVICGWDRESSAAGLRAPPGFSAYSYAPTRDPHAQVAQWLDVHWRVAGFQYASGGDANVYEACLIVPCWAVAAALAVPPAARLAAARRRRRRSRMGRCPACGYDLTFNESGACSECGRATAGKVTP